MMLYHGKRLRIGRCSEPGRIYLITSATRHREPLFKDWQTGRLVSRALREAHEAGAVASLAWVVMPDHFHWLFELTNGDLSGTVRRVKSRTALAVNEYLGSSGPVWQKGFHDRAMRKNEDLRSAARYIIYNPVRAGLVASPREYCLWDAMWL